MIKTFSNLIYKKKDKNLSLKESVPKEPEKKKSKQLIIFGILISISSIFLLLLTINIKFG